MSREDIDRLVAERSLALEEFDDAQVAGFWTKAVASYSDARVPGVSSDGAFQLAYTAALQATFAVLAARGLRVRSTASHYKAFYAMQKLDDALRRHAVHFDEMRATRHESIYEPDEDDATLASRLAEAVSYLASAPPEIRSWLIAARPGLARTLRSVDPG